jgi:hypothetical protein
MSDHDTIASLRAEVRELRLNQQMFAETLDRVSRELATARELVDAVGEDVCKLALRQRNKLRGDV